MLIKMKLPERKDSPNGMSCTCNAFAYVKCGCGADWSDNTPFNEALDQVESLNQPLVRGMEIDVEAFAKEMFEVCVYPGLEKWEEQTNHIKTRWRTNAEIIRDNAHVWLKEKDSK